MSIRATPPNVETRLPVAVRVGIWMSVSAFCFAVMVGIVRYLSDGLDVFVITFWRNAVAFVMFLPWLVIGGPKAFRTRRFGLYVGRGVLMVTATTTLFFGVVLMPIAAATALSFSSPLFSAVLAVIVLKEIVGPRRWIALAVGFIGVLVLLRPGSATFDPAAALILLSALSFAGVMVTGKMLARSDGPGLITFYLAALSVTLSLVPAAFFWQWPSGSEWLWLIALGVLGNVNLYTIARALAIGDASLSMAFDFIRLPMTAAVGIFVFAERPDVWTWVGAAIIFAASLYISHRETMAERASRGSAPDGL